jgi:transposase InsO family protein
LSRLSVNEGQGSVQNSVLEHKKPTQQEFSVNTDLAFMHEQRSGTLDHNFSILVDDEELLECLLSLPEVTPEQPFALNFEQIANAQQAQEGLLQKITNDPTHYTQGTYGLSNTELMLYRASPEDSPKVCIPDSMLDTIVNFYHQAMVHTGTTRLYQSIAQHFVHKQLKQRCDDVALSCETCQLNKAANKGYGHHPPREAHFAPWYEVAVDLIGTWTVNDENGNAHSFTALTIIDTVTTYCEVILLQNKTAQHVGWHFEHQWLSRYPRPARCVYDQGSEFLGEAFQQVLRRHGIASGASVVKNPQSNAVCERIHQSIGNSLRALNYAHPPRNEVEAQYRVDTALQTAAYAARVAMHTTMKMSPGSMAFHRDMILNIPMIVDFELLRQRRQALIDKNLIKANAARIDHDYQPGQYCYKKAYNPDKMEPRFTGPYLITQVHTNGTVVIQVDDNVTERINIRRIKPRL